MSIPFERLSLSVELPFFRVWLPLVFVLLATPDPEPLSSSLCFWLAALFPLAALSRVSLSPPDIPEQPDSLLPLDLSSLSFESFPGIASRYFWPLSVPEPAESPEARDCTPLMLLRLPPHPMPELDMFPEVSFKSDMRFWSYASTSVMPSM